MKALRWLVILPMLSLAACAWWMAERSGVYDLDRLLFVHSVHQEEDVDCATCHAGAATAVDTHVALTPKEAVCLECHEREDCGMCHTDVAKAAARTARASELGFSHAAHMPRVGDKGCDRCHAAAASQESSVSLPSMQSCLNCHNHQQDYAQARCLDCHPTLRNKPLKAVAEFEHSGDWMSLHGLTARSQSASCLQCHSESTCSECHSNVAPMVNSRLFAEAVERPLLHRGDWRSTHALDARADGDTCVRCHTTNYCVSCHGQHGLTSGVTGGRVQHPPGWATPGGAFHGDEARLRIENCAACHDQGTASNCVECHKIGGIGGNPHPAGWSRRQSATSIASNSMCRVCHIGSR